MENEREREREREKEKEKDHVDKEKEREKPETTPSPRPVKREMIALANSYPFGSSTNVFSSHFPILFPSDIYFTAFQWRTRPSSSYT